MIVILGLPGCRREAPEEAIRTAIGGMQAAGEARDVSAVFERSPDD